MTISSALALNYNWSMFPKHTLLRSWGEIAQNSKYILGHPQSTQGERLLPPELVLQENGTRAPKLEVNRAKLLRASLLKESNASQTELHKPLSPTPWCLRKTSLRLNWWARSKSRGEGRGHRKEEGRQGKDDGGGGGKERRKEKGSSQNCDLIPSKTCKRRKKVHGIDGTDSNFQLWNLQKQSPE